MGGTGQPLADSKAASRVGVQLPIYLNFASHLPQFWLNSVLTVSGYKLDSHYYFSGQKQGAGQPLADSASHSTLLNMPCIAHPPHFWLNSVRTTTTIQQSDYP